jgi:uncharacterized protein YggE
MKQGTAICLVLLGILLVGATALRGQPAGAEGPEATPQKRTIGTAGSATVRVKPDSARVFFGVQTFASTVKAARTENSQRVQRILAALDKLEIPELKAKTSNVQLNVERRPQSDRNPGGDAVGYHVVHTFTVLVRNGDPERLGALTSRVLDTVLEAGANQVEQVVFFKQDEVEARRQALTKAVEEAVANARALAGGIHAQLKDTVQIQGQPTYYYGGNRMVQTNATLPEGDSTPLVAGDLEVSCQVSVTCTF